MAKRRRWAWFIGCGLPVLACIMLVLSCILPEFLFPLSEQDKTQIETRYQEFCDALASRQYDKTYTFMSPGFQSMHPFESYKKEYEKGYPKEQFGLKEACDWHKPPEGGLNRATLYQYYDWPMLIGPVVDLSKENGVWYIDGASWSMD